MAVRLLTRPSRLPSVRDAVLALIAAFLVYYHGWPALAALAQEGGQQAPRDVLRTAFTHQGRLVVDGIPANGAYDFEFALFDAATAGNQVAMMPPLTNVAVTNGLYSVQLDFGANAFDGDARWLRVRAKTAGAATFTDLGRQELTATPYALYARATDWAGITNKPAGLEDGDQDTTYTAQSPVAINGTVVGLSTTNCQEGDVWVFTDPGWSCNNAGGGGPHNHFGEAWSGSVEDDAGLLVTNSGDGPGLRGEGDSLLYAAVEGANSAAGPCAPFFFSCAGVSGGTAAVGGTGVEGIAFQGTGVTGDGSTGVFGRSSSGQFGVRGEANFCDVNTNCIGVMGQSDSSPNGKGVYGLGSAVGVLGLGPTGVEGESSVLLGTGVHGKGTGLSGTGVLGEGHPNSGTGVRGAGEVGVEGESSVAGGIGVSGVGPVGVKGVPSVVEGVGVEGDGGSVGNGVVGRSTRPGFSAIYGENHSGFGVRGVGGTGVWGTASSAGQAGVLGHAHNSAISCTFAGVSTLCYGVIGDASNTPGQAGIGVMGIGTNTGIWGRAALAGGYAGVFDGKVVTRGLSEMGGHMVPTQTLVFDNGLPSARWDDVWGNTLHYNNLVNESDVRLKRDVQPVRYGLEEVLQLAPVTFAYERGLDDGRQHLGLVAQDVRDIIPELVSVGEDEEKLLSLSTIELIPVLIRAIQEQQAEIDALSPGAGVAASGEVWMAWAALGLSAAALLGVLACAVIMVRGGRIRIVLPATHA